MVQSDVGSGSGYSNQEYADAGAEMLDAAAEIYEAADMIIKVKEPLPEEYRKLRDGQIIYTSIWPRMWSSPRH